MPRQRTARARREFAGSALRFLIGGGLNTVATLLLYWLLLEAMPAQPAYALSFVAGIGLSYLINTAFVFRTRRAWRSFLPFPLVYVLGYAVGALVLAAATGPFGIDARVAPLLSVAATLPLTFALTRWLLHRRS